MKQSLFFIIFLILITNICDTVSQLFLKSSINLLDLHINTVKKGINLVIQLIKIPRIWVGFVFSTLSLVIWLFVLTRADLNLAVSFDSMRYVLVAWASMVVLKEKVSIVRWLGVICVICGIMLVAMG